MFSEVFPGAVKPGFYRRDAGAERDRDLGVAAAFLHQCEQGTVLRPELGERVPQRVEFFGADGAFRLGDVLMFRGEWREYPAQFLTAEVIDTGVSGQTKQPRLELQRSLEPIKRPHHFDEDELGDVFDRVAAPDNRVNKPGDAVLVGHDELALGIRFAALRAADEFD
jgi:hypothetical protein